MNGGSREEVWDGAVNKTAGGLKRIDLVLGADGTIQSRRVVMNARDRAAGGRGFISDAARFRLNHPRGD